MQLESVRLILRSWRSEDRPAFARINADPEVMRYFPTTLNRDQSDAAIDRFQDSIETRGFGFWAAEIKHSAEFIGFVGLNVPDPALPCSPCVEIGWRLVPEAWGQGFASEGAQRSLQHAFEQLQLDSVIAMTTTTNVPSQKVMQRIGMTDTGDNFLHPNIDPQHALAEHVLYRIARTDWLSKQNR